MLNKSKIPFYTLLDDVEYDILVKKHLLGIRHRRESIINNMRWRYRYSVALKPQIDFN